MRIHSDVLTPAQFHKALADCGIAQEGVMIDVLYEYGSRKRKRAYEVHLDAFPGRDRNGKKRRYCNSGTMGAGQNTAATYDEWGYWIAELFEIDPDAVMSYYQHEEHFHEVTRDAYRKVHT